MAPERHLRPTYEQAFWNKVDKSGECWAWTGCTDSNGYGRYRSGSLAHRISWKLTHGQIPGRLRVLHKCDNPPCVRPDHLYIGTQADNLADMRRKGRWRVRAGYIAVSDENAELARRMYQNMGGKWGSIRLISKALGIGYSNTSRIVRSKSRATFQDASDEDVRKAMIESWQWGEAAYRWLADR